MKFLQFCRTTLRGVALTASATVAVFLAGCAAPGTNTSSTPAASTSSTAGGTASLSTPHQAVYPTGPLSPIAAGQAASGSVAPLAPPVDMWDRIRRGFAMPDLDNDLVRDREQWYAARPDYMQRMTERSNKYLFHVVEELERRGMPTELALLPFIESAFNPQAVSSAKAAGMWQFMPATGSFFALKQNVFRDDRRDVLASTRAALDYLQKLYGMFGDWHLALAAYNWGEGNVSRAIAKNQKAGLGTGYLDLNMPNETRYYVPKLQAVKNLVAHPERFNFELPLIENHPYFQSVLIMRDIDVELAAKLADVRIEDFRALNPAAHRPVILAAGQPEILLPWDNAAVFYRNLQAYTAGQYASWTAWVVPTTMTVAAAAQRAGMSEADLRSVNTIPPRMLIKAGSTLIVPRSAKIIEDVALSTADNGQLSLAPEIVTRRTLVKARKGETVTSLANRYKLSAASVAEWNEVSSKAAFKAGQSVVVFLPVTAPGAGRHSSRANSGGPRAALGSTRASTRHVSKSSRSAAPAAATSKRGGTPVKKKR